MKIVMLGPVFPYKGGISHYTGMMSRNLAKKHEVINISFSLQYPRILYKSTQKDYKNDTFKVEGTQFILNTVNPFSWIKTARTINKLAPDMLIVQWWHPFFAPCYWSILKLLQKNIQVVFLCHNVLPHEGFPAKKVLTKMVLNNGDHFIVHSALDAEDLKQLVHHPQYVQTVHPTYNAFKMHNMASDTARQQLGYAHGENLLLFFGYIREYKGLRHLINALSAVKIKCPNIHLMVVGDFFEGNKEEYLTLIKQNGVQDFLTLYEGYIPDKEVEQYFAACDLVVLPYESATQSGIVQIAYSFEKPVIATNVGGLPEVVLDGKTGFVIPPRDTDALTDAIVRFFTENRSVEFAKHISQESYRYEWDRMTEIIDNLCAKNKLYKGGTI